MNIDEERKAFQTALPENADWAFTDGKFAHSIIQKRFEAWLAGKGHAVETAKPTVKVQQALSPFFDTHASEWNVWLTDNNTFNGIIRKSDTEAEALQWAKDNGYRVIE